MIHPEDREAALIVTGMIYAARVQAYETMRLRTMASPTVRPPALEDITGETAALFTLVDRHLPPETRKQLGLRKHNPRK